jgi:Na+/H+ antiporter NhaD/arsenite permease-like protein
VPAIHGIPLEFFIFGLMLLGVAVLHRHALPIAVFGLLAIIAFKLGFTGFDAGGGLPGLALHFAHEWVTLVNLLFLLLGFSLLARHFEDSGVPAILPDYLPDGWTGGLVLLVMVFALSSFLDNIAAALIGGAMAHTLFRGRVHIGYLAAIVAASNAGGAGSVIGDTTTTMMWIRGVAPSEVLHAYVAAFTALLIFGIPAALQQQRWSPIAREAPPDARVDWVRLAVVAAVLSCAVAVNVAVNTQLPGNAGKFPLIGVAVAISLLVTVPLRRPDWTVVPAAFKGSVFLLSLVASASLMPVEALPLPSWQSALGLGFVSAVFDNIPLTALALKQGGYDWGFLAYAVGFGGSMIWFGSSAGVALSSLFPETRSTGRWLRHGWHVTLGYVLGFFALLLTLGWHPHTPH